MIPNTRFFWEKVDKAGECWIYRGALNSSGYGNVGYGGKNWGAHRLAYVLMVGWVPDDLTLDHLCRNRACVNPAHLEAVEERENILRGVSRAAFNARKTHCHRGHEFTHENTYWNSRGRDCRACARERQRLRRVRAAAETMTDEDWLQ